MKGGGGEGLNACMAHCKTQLRMRYLVDIRENQLLFCLASSKGIGIGIGIGKLC